MLLVNHLHTRPRTVTGSIGNRSFRFAFTGFLPI